MFDDQFRGTLLEPCSCRLQQDFKVYVWSRVVLPVIIYETNMILGGRGGEQSWSHDEVDQAVTSSRCHPVRGPDWSDAACSPPADSLVATLINPGLTNGVDNSL